MKRVFAILALVIISFSVAHAQNTCSEKLRQAQRNFDEGLLDDIPTMIDSCLKDGFTNEEKMNAYKLLIQTYLFNDEVDRADSIMLQFLKDLPSYQISTTDLKEFINLYNTYQTEPLFKWEVEAGINYSYPTVTEYFSVGNLNQTNASYSSKVGAQIGVNYTDKINHRFDWSAGINATFYRMSYTSNEFNYSTTTADFTNLTIGVPIAIKYVRSFSGFKAFIKAGFETTYQLKATADFSRTFTNGDNPIQSTEDLIELYNRIDIRPMASIGVTLKMMNKFELIPSIGFKLSTIKSLKDDSRLRNNELIYKYTYSGDNLRQSMVYLNVAFVIPYYNPRKIK